MNNLRELLQDADPLRHEPTPAPDQRITRRQAVLAAARRTPAPSRRRPRSRTAVWATSALMVAALLALGAVLWSLFNSNLQAAIRFEVRMAETRPAAGLQKAKVAGSDRYVYLHHQVIVSNNDIAEVKVIQADAPSQYGIGIRFNSTGADKMRQATRAHIGKPLAILLDGQVMMAPVVRDPVGGSAMLTGHYTKAEAQRVADRIVKGIGMQ
jgi:preprotein translocase subunit SecD